MSEISNGKFSMATSRHGKYLIDMKQDLKSRGIEATDINLADISNINIELFQQYREDILVILLTPDSVLFKSKTDSSQLDTFREQVFMLGRKEADEKLEVFFQLLNPSKEDLKASSQKQKTQKQS
jgi:hypothetical protein